MTKYQIAAALLVALPMASAFRPPSMRIMQANLKVIAEDTMDTASTKERPIYDPLGLYPETSEEKQQGRIQPLESQPNWNKKIKDPLGLYPRNSPEFLDSWQEEQAAIDMTNNVRPLFDPMGLYSIDTAERQEGRIQPMEPTDIILKEVTDPMGLYPRQSEQFLESLNLERQSLTVENRVLYDPLRIYSMSSPEYQEGKIQALEPRVNVVKPVLDPLGLYSPSQTVEEVDTDTVMSEALPFMAWPAVLQGELMGDVGFDPLGFAQSKEGLLFQRQAELKHSRIAMLAAAGWPLSELFHPKLAALFHLTPLLVSGDRVPSVLNGGLGHVNPFYWMGVLAVAGMFEALDVTNKGNLNTSIFDPLQLYPTDELGQKRMQLAEIKNGRLAMMAIAAFATTEALTHQSVVIGTPFFFHPPF